MVVFVVMVVIKDVVFEQSFFCLGIVIGKMLLCMVCDIYLYDKLVEKFYVEVVVFYDVVVGKDFVVKVLLIDGVCDLD